MGDFASGFHNPAFTPAHHTSGASPLEGLGKHAGITEQGHLKLPNGKVHKIEIALAGGKGGVKTLAEVKQLLMNGGRDREWAEISDKLNSMMQEVFDQMEAGDCDNAEGTVIGVSTSKLKGRAGELSNSRNFQKKFARVIELIDGVVTRSLASLPTSLDVHDPSKLPLSSLVDTRRQEGVIQRLASDSDVSTVDSGTSDGEAADAKAALLLEDEERLAEANRQKKNEAAQRAARANALMKKTISARADKLIAERAKADASVKTLDAYFDRKIKVLRTKSSKPGITDFKRRSNQATIQRLGDKRAEFASVRGKEMGTKSLEYFVEAWMDKETWSLVSEETGEIGWDKEMSQIVDDSNVRDGETMNERFLDFIYTELGGSENFESCVLGKEILAQFDKTDGTAESVLGDKWGGAKSEVNDAKTKIGHAATRFTEKRRRAENRVKVNLANAGSADELLPRHASKEKLNGLIQSFNAIGTAGGDLASLEGDIQSLERTARSLKKEIKGDERVRTGGKYNETIAVLNHIIAFSKAGQSGKEQVKEGFRASSFEAVLSSSFHKMIGPSEAYENLKSFAKILDGEQSLLKGETKSSISAKFVEGLKTAVAADSLDDVNDPKGAIRTFNNIQVEALEEILVGEVVAAGGTKVEFSGVSQESHLPPAALHQDANWKTDNIVLRGHLRLTTDAEVTEFKDLSGVNSPFGREGRVSVSRLTEILTDKGIHQDRKMSMLHAAAANIAVAGLSDVGGSVEDLKTAIEDLSRFDRSPVDTEKRQDSLIALFFEGSKEDVSKQAAYPMLQKHLEGKKSLSSAERAMYDHIKTAVSNSNPGTDAFIQIVGRDPLLQSILFTECQKKYPDALRGGDVPQMEVIRSPESTKFHLKFTDGNLSKKDFTLNYSNSGSMAIFDRDDSDKLRKKGSWSTSDIKSLLLEHEPHQAMAIANALGDESATLRSLAESMTSADLRVESLLGFITDIERSPDDAGFYNSDQMELLETLVFQDSVLEKELDRNPGNVKALVDKFTKKALESDPSRKDCMGNGKNRMLYMFFARMSMQLKDRTGMESRSTAQVESGWQDFTPNLKAADVDRKHPSNGAVLEYKTKAQLVLVQAHRLSESDHVDAGQYLDLVDNMRKLNEMPEGQGGLVHSYFSKMIDDAVRDLEALVERPNSDVLEDIFSGGAREKDRLLAPLLELAGSDSNDIRNSNSSDWKSLGMGVFEFKTGGRNYQINVTTGETMVDGKKYSVTERKMLENETYLECFGRQKLTYQECNYQPQIREKEVLEGNLAFYAEEIQSTYDAIVQEEVTQVIDVIHEFINDEIARGQEIGQPLGRDELKGKALQELDRAKLFIVGRDAGDDRGSSENIVRDLLASIDRASGSLSLTGITEKYVAALKTKTLAVNMSEIDEITKFDAQARMGESKESRTLDKRDFTARNSMEKRLANIKNRQKSFHRLKEARYNMEKKSLLTEFRLDKGGMTSEDFKGEMESIMREYGHDTGDYADELTTLLTNHCPGKTLEDCKLVESKFFKNGDYIIKVTPKSVGSDQVDVEIFNNSTLKEESLGAMRESTTTKLSHAAQEKFSLMGMVWEKLLADETKAGEETHGERALRRGGAINEGGKIFAAGSSSFTSGSVDTMGTGWEVVKRGFRREFNFGGVLLGTGEVIGGALLGTAGAVGAALGVVGFGAGKITEASGDLLQASSNTVENLAQTFDVFARTKHVEAEDSRDEAEVARNFQVITSLSGDKFEAFSGVRPNEDHKKQTYQFISRSKCMDSVAEGSEKELLKGLFDQHDPPLKAWVREKPETGLMFKDKHFEIVLRDKAGNSKYTIADGRVYKGDASSTTEAKPLLSAYEDSSVGGALTSELGEFLGDAAENVATKVEAWKTEGYGGKVSMEMQVNCSDTSHVSLIATGVDRTWRCKGEEDYQLVLTQDPDDPIHKFIDKFGLSNDQSLLIFQSKNNPEQKLFYLQIGGEAHKFYASPDGGVQAANREGRFVLAQEYMKTGDFQKASAMLEEPWIDHETKNQTELSERENQILQELIDKPGAGEEGRTSTMRRNLFQAQLAQRKYQATFLMKDAIVPDNRELHSMVSALAKELEGNKRSAKPVKIPKNFRNQLADLSDYFARTCSDIPDSRAIAEKLVPSNDSMWASVSVSGDADIREAYQKEFSATSLLETLLLNPETTIKKGEERGLNADEKEARMAEVRPDRLNDAEWVRSSQELMKSNQGELNAGQRDQVQLYTALKKREAELERAIDAERVSEYETPGGEEALGAVGDRMKVRLEQQLSANKSLSINLQGQLSALASQVSMATGVETDADDLIVMIMHSSPHLKKLSADDQLKIQNLALRYLFVRTEMQQLRLMSGELKTNGLTADNRDKIGEILHSKREYDVDKILNSPAGEIGDRKRLDTLACLFCEFNQGFRLRKDQMGYLKGMLNASSFDREVGRNLDLDLEKRGGTHEERLIVLRETLSSVGRKEDTAKFEALLLENSEKVPPLSEGALREIFLKGEIRKGWLEREGEDETDFAQLAQMPTGFGKTDVFFITLALRNADGNTLVKLTAPDALKSINLGDMNKKLRRLFQNRVKEFTFEAGISKEQRVPYLKEKLALLQSAIKNGHALITSPDSADRPIFALMKQMEDEGNNIGEAYGLLKKIVKLFHEQSIDIIDEADKCSDIHQKTNLVGTTEVNVSKEQMQIMGDVFTAASKIDGAISDKLGYNLETSYHNAGGFKDRILDSYLSETKDGIEMLRQAGEAGIETEDLKRYLTSRRQEDFGDAASFSSFKTKLKSCSSFGKAAYLKSSLNNYFPNSQSNTNRLGSSFDVVHGANRFATPFHNGEPDIGSKFEDPGETAAYTFQAYMQSQGLFSREDNKTAVTDYFVDAIVNRKAGEKLSFLPFQKQAGGTWTEALRGKGDAWQSLGQLADLIEKKVKDGCEDADLIRAQLGSSMSEDPLKSLFNRANTSKDVVLKLVEHVILNEDLKTAPKSYEGNRDHRLSRNGATLAFSATLVKPTLSESWNQMDSKMRPDLVLAQQKQIKRIGAEPCHALSKAADKSQMAIQYFRQDLKMAARNLKSGDPNLRTQMLVDSAGLWAGGEESFNLTMAQEAYTELCNPASGAQLKKFIVYYDTEAKSLMMLKHKTGLSADEITPVPFEKHIDTGPDDYFIILDQGRSTGTDTKAVQFEGHHEILTLGPGVTESDFLQAKGRSRMKDHSWSFSCPASFAERAATMSNKRGGVATNEDLLNLVFLETDRQNNTDDFQSFSDELNSHVSAKAREVLEKASGTISEDDQGFLKGFLGNQGPSSELASYFDLPREYVTTEEKKDYLLKKYDEMIGKLVRMQEMLPSDLRGSDTEMEVKSSQIGQLMTTLLQRKIQSIAVEGGTFIAGSMGVGATVKQQQQQQVQQQVTAQVQVQAQVQLTNQVMTQQEVEMMRKLTKPASTHILASDSDPEAMRALREEKFDEFATRYSVGSTYSDDYKAVDMSRVIAPTSFVYDHVDFEGVDEASPLMKQTFDLISRDFMDQATSRSFTGLRTANDFSANRINTVMGSSGNKNSAVAVEILSGQSIGESIRNALRVKGVVDEDVLTALREGVEQHFERINGSMQMNRLGQVISPADYKIVLLNPYVNMPKNLDKFGLPKGAQIAVSHAYKRALTEGRLGLKFATTCLTCGRVACGCNPTLMAELEDTSRQIDPIVVKIGQKYNIMTREEFENLPEDLKRDSPDGGRIRPITGG